MCMFISRPPKKSLGRMPLRRCRIISPGLIISSKTTLIIGPRDRLPRNDPRHYKQRRSYINSPHKVLGICFYFANNDAFQRDFVEPRRCGSNKPGDRLELVRRRTEWPSGHIPSQLCSGSEGDLLQRRAYFSWTKTRRPVRAASEHCTPSKAGIETS